MSGEKMEKEKKRSTETQKHCVNRGTGASYFVIKTKKNRVMNGLAYLKVYIKNKL